LTRTESAVRAIRVIRAVALRDRFAVMLAAADPGAVLGGRGGDGLGLVELARVGRDGDAEEGARHVVASEGGGDLVPGGGEVASVPSSATLARS
jgi:hypothetical protein